jgi:hypothetical protein
MAGSFAIRAPVGPLLNLDKRTHLGKVASFATIGQTLKTFPTHVISRAQLKSHLQTNRLAMGAPCDTLLQSG